MRKLRHLLIACVLCCFGVAVAAEMPAGVKVEKNGTFTVAEAKVQLKIYGENWARTTNAQWSDVKSAPGRGGLDLSAKLKVNGVEGTVKEKLTPVAANAFRLECQYDFVKETQMNICCASIFPRRRARRKRASTARISPCRQSLRS